VRRVGRCRLRLTTVGFYFNCKHNAALLRTAAAGQKRLLIRKHLPLSDSRYVGSTVQFRRSRLRHPERAFRDQPVIPEEGC
jgi:hypothetical protein